MTEIITVVGNITQPEFKTTNSGVPIVNFRIASTERRFDKAEEKWVDGATNWYSVSAFRRLAEHVRGSFRKGDRVIVTGRLRLRDWETAAKKGVTAEIDADALGHDLLWGITMFHRESGPGSVDATRTDPWEATTGSVDVGDSPSIAVTAWPASIPGQTSLRGDSNAVDAADDDPESELVGTRAGAPF